MIMVFTLLFIGLVFVFEGTRKHELFISAAK